MQALSQGGTPPGTLDDAAESILPLLEGQLFGAAADSAEHTGFVRKHKEARSIKSYDSYQLLWSMTTFETHAEVLLMTVRDRLPECSVPGIRRKVQQLLQYAVRGVQGNEEGAGAQAVLQWVWGQLNRSLSQSANSTGPAWGFAGAAGGVEDGGVRSCLWKPSNLEADSVQIQMSSALQFSTSYPCLKEVLLLIQLL